MHRAVDDLKRATKEVESRLAMLEWKSETLSQNCSNPIMYLPEEEIPSVSTMLRDVTKVKKEYKMIREDLKSAIETQRESMEHLHDSLEAVEERFTKLVGIVGELPE